MFDGKLNLPFESVVVVNGPCAPVVIVTVAFGRATAAAASLILPVTVPEAVANGPSSTSVGVGSGSATVTGTLTEPSWCGATGIAAETFAVAALIVDTVHVPGRSPSWTLPLASVVPVTGGFG